MEHSDVGLPPNIGVGGEGIVERSPTGRYVRFWDKLGSGASKDVYRAYDTREGIEVAWNVVNLSGVPKYERNRIVNEVRLLERLHHPNIISFHGSWVNRERQEVHFITEVLSAGTLKSFVMKVQVIRWKIAKRWLRQILDGLAYLHSQGVIHRDLKCDNIFINGTSGDLRIGDLGLCTLQRGDGPALSVLGTPEFMAPDMYEEHISYDEKIDIYSFGMCMLEICTHETPYIECSNPAQIYRKVSKGEHPRSLNRIKNREAREFILLCLGRKDSSGNGKYVRPSAAQLLSHPFLVAEDDDDDIIRVEPPTDKQSVSVSTPATASVVTASTDALDAIEESNALKSAGGKMGTVSSDSSSKEREEVEKQNTDGKPQGTADPFLDMPQSESGFTGKQVTVLSGRGKELKKDAESDKQEQKELECGSPSPSTSSDAASKASKQTSSTGSKASRPSSSIGSAATHEKAILQESPAASKTTSMGSEATQQGSISQVSVSTQHTGGSEATAEDMMQYQLHQQHLQQQQLQHQQQQLAQLQLQQQQLQHQQHQQHQYQQQQLQHPQQLQHLQLQQLKQRQLQQQQMQQQQQLQQQFQQQQFEQQQQPQPAQQKQHHYLVAAAIIEKKDVNEQGVVLTEGQQAQSTLLPLVLTLPVQGHTQNVQFDFDLVQDDPIQVAREMVTELGIPQDAVLEISETISGLASSARMKREEMQQVLQQEQEDKEEQLVQQMRDLASQNREQLEQQEQQQLQIEHQQHQIHMQQQQHQIQQAQLQKQREQQSLLLQARRHVIPEHAEATTPTPGSEIAGGADSEEQSSDEGEFNKELARIDEGYRFSMAQARKVYDNRISNLQQEQDDRDAQHIEALEKHEKDRAEFHDLMKETQQEENRRVDELQREWDERREQLAKDRKSRWGPN